jgi:hypothetical protein
MSSSSSESIRRRRRGVLSLLTAAVVAFGLIPNVEPASAADTDPFSIVLIPRHPELHVPGHPQGHRQQGCFRSRRSDSVELQVAGSARATTARGPDSSLAA